MNDINFARRDADDEIVGFDDFVSVSEAARLLSISEVTLRRWVTHGRIKAYRLGPKKLRLRRRELASLVSPAKVEAGGRVVNGVVLVPMSSRRRSDADIVSEARAMLDAQRKRRGNKVVVEAWEDINAARDERSDHL
jgi:excisionase family DNA binding protein